MHRKILTALVSAYLLTGCGSADKKSAQDCAETYFRLLDTGKYAEAYDSSAAVYKEKVSKADFVASMESSYNSLGPVISRTLKSATPTSEPTFMGLKEVPGGAPGQFVSLDYNTDFAKQKAMVEHISPMKQADSSWKVPGLWRVKADDLNKGR